MAIIARIAVGVVKTFVTSWRLRKSSCWCGVEAALALQDDLDGAQAPRPEQRRDAGRPRPLAHAVEALAVLDLVAVDELLVGEDVAVGVDDALGQAGGAATCSRAAPGRRRRCRRSRTRSTAPSSRPSSRTRISSTSDGSKRAALASSVTSTRGCESRRRWRDARRRRRAPTSRAGSPAFFHVPKKTAAVSGVGGSTTATRSPRSTPWSRRTLAAWLERSCSSPQVTSRRRAVEALPDHRRLVARVLVADVGGDVVALGDVPPCSAQSLLVAAHGAILAHRVFARWRCGAGPSVTTPRRPARRPSA